MFELASIHDSNGEIFIHLKSFHQDPFLTLLGSTLSSVPLESADGRNEQAGFTSVVCRQTSQVDAVG